MRSIASIPLGGCLVLLFLWTGCGDAGGGTSASDPGTPTAPPGHDVGVPGDGCAALRDHPEFQRTFDALDNGNYEHPGVLAAGMLLAAKKVPADAAMCPCSELRQGDQEPDNQRSSRKPGGKKNEKGDT
jgi:hypothetical protein